MRCPQISDRSGISGCYAVVRQSLQRRAAVPTKSSPSPQWVFDPVVGNAFDDVVGTRTTVVTGAIVVVDGTVCGGTVVVVVGTLTSGPTARHTTWPMIASADWPLGKMPPGPDA